MTRPSEKVKKPVTAAERQREREEKRRKRQEKAAEKERKKRESEGHKPKLSEEDKTLLERWSNMQVRFTCIVVVVMCKFQYKKTVIFIHSFRHKDHYGL